MGSADDIRERSTDWVAAGIIEPEQARQIDAYERERDAGAGESAPAHDTRAKMQAIFGVLGGLLVGLGVLLTVATNWDVIADPFKVVIIVVFMLASYLVGFVVDARGAPRWSGSVAWVVGVGTFAGGLAILGEEFNVGVHKPLAALFVALAATAVAVFAERTTVGWVAGAAWLGWLAWEAGDSLSGMPEELFAGALMSCVVLVGISGFAASFVLEGFSNAGAGSTASRLRVLDLPLRCASLLMLLGSLVQSSFAWHWDWDNTSAMPRLEQWLAFALAALTCTALLRLGRIESRRAVVVALLAIAVTVLAVSWIHQQHAVSVAASVVLACGGIGLMYLGMVESRSELFIFGIAWLAILVVTRYLDFVFAVDLGGPGFIGVGLLLILLAWLVGRSRSLWTRRREVVG